MLGPPERACAKFLFETAWISWWIIKPGLLFQREKHRKVWMSRRQEESLSADFHQMAGNWPMAGGDFLLQKPDLVCDGTKKCPVNSGVCLTDGWWVTWEAFRSPKEELFTHSDELSAGLLASSCSLVLNCCSLITPQIPGYLFEQVGFCAASLETLNNFRKSSLHLFCCKNITSRG